MNVLLGPTPCHGCGTPVSVVRALVASPRAIAPDLYRRIVIVETDGLTHACTQERRPTMSRAAIGGNPTRRYHDGAHRFPVPGDATPPAPSIAATP